MDDQPRRNIRRRRRRPDKNRNPNQNPNVEYPLCPLCQKQIKELYYAIEEKNTEKPAHFDCVVKQIASEEKLQPNERICYLGKGVFGVVKEEKQGIGFSIIKKIQYEKKDEIPQWRKDETERRNRGKQKGAD